MTPFIGQIQPFGFSFAPVGWALCNGVKLQISQYTELFSLIGATFGGDGRNNFAVPNLMGRSIVGQGIGPGLSQRVVGQTGGTETTTLSMSNMPSHTHTANLGNSLGIQSSGKNAYFAFDAFGDNIYTTKAPAEKSLATATLGSTGNSSSFTNRIPYVGIYYGIAVQGVYPQRS